MPPKAKGKGGKAKVTAPPVDVDEQFNFELTIVVSKPQQEADVMNQPASSLLLDCNIEEMFSLKTAHLNEGLNSANLKDPLCYTFELFCNSVPIQTRFVVLAECKSTTRSKDNVITTRECSLSKQELTDYESDDDDDTTSLNAYDTHRTKRWEYVYDVLTEAINEIIGIVTPISICGHEITVTLRFFSHVVIQKVDCDDYWSPRNQY